MAWTQYVMACTVAAQAGAGTEGAHPAGILATDCTAIVCADETGRVAWVSHAPSAVDPATRINPTIPADDRRATP